MRSGALSDDERLLKQARLRDSLRVIHIICKELFQAVCLLLWMLAENCGDIPI